MTGSIKTGEVWIAEWLDAVQDGSAAMSQRRRSSIDKNGGLEEVIAAAKQRDVHLAELIDDKGNLLVAASRHPFRSLC
ncbi:MULTISPECIES: hypothetical protein [unclassified Sphingomonas]|uniref:hypothetical protein n=1 Tax=unclassified Sphingomonas TaxID=196159 RepID=UPI00226AFBDF|nr:MULTISPECIES: hypothetical protein [unclassified Sphingomonas]